MCPGCDVALSLNEAATAGGGLLRLVKDVERESNGGAEPPEADPFDNMPLFEAHRKLYPAAVSGTFRRIKWIVLAVTLGLYYFIPFLRWDRGPGAPSQAVLIDLPGRRMYFFFIEIWPQEIYYVTGLLIIAAMVLFLMNAVAGRVWCGYLCPQTVWTDLFYAIERRIEGDRREHMQRDAAPWTAEKVARKALKHFLWLMVAWWTGGAWVLYFADAPTLVKDLATGQAPLIAYAWIAILTFTTYTLAGFMREQVCLYMCPWPRIQAALTDEHALNVTYRYDRGEPRGSLKKNANLRKQGLPAGDCVDCLQCVYVCPTGVDIRKGPSLGCIQCGLCIDACDAVMAKVGHAPRLIAYDTDLNVRRRARGEPTQIHLLRPRSALYAGIIAIVGAVMLYTFVARGTINLSVLHDRNPLFVRLTDGEIRNGYTVRILNMRNETRYFTFDVLGLPGAVVDIAGIPTPPEGDHAIEVGPDQTRELRLLIADPTRQSGSTTPISIVMTDRRNGETAHASDYFRGP